MSKICALQVLIIPLIIFTDHVICNPYVTPINSRAVDLQGLLQSLSNCFVRIFALQTAFDFSSSNVPFVLTNVNNYDFCPKNSEGFHYMYLPDKFVENIAVLKLSSIKCFAGVILQENEYTDERISTSTTPDDINCLISILSLEGSLRYFRIVNYEAVHAQELRIYPRTYFVFTNSIREKTVSESHKGYITALLKHDNTFSYFIIEYSPVLGADLSALQDTKELYYILHNCDWGYLIRSKCPDVQGSSIYQSLSTCYKKATGNGRHYYAWAAYEIGNLDFGLKFCPNSVTEEDFSLSSMTALGFFLREDFNGTLRETICSQKMMEVKCRTRFDYEFIRTSDISDGYQFYMVGYNDFIFFTTDGVYEVKNAFHEYLAPFDPNVRFTLATAFITVALILTGITLQHGIVSGVLIQILFQLFSIMIEQGTKLSVSKSAKSVLTTSRKIVLISFIPAAMILSIYYKSFLKSDFTIPTPYKTEWGTLKQLVDEGFEILVPMENCRLRCRHRPHEIIVVVICKPDQSDDLAAAVMCQQLIKYQKYISYYQAVSRYDSEVEKFGIEHVPEHFSTVYALGNQSTYFCLEFIQEFLPLRLNIPKTALVVFRRHFNYFWRLFQEGQGNGKKIAHNLDSRDSLLNTPRGYYIATTGDDNYNWVHKRMNVLLSSGIYWFWETMEKMDDDDVKPTTIPVKALTIPDFELALNGWMRLLIVCTVVLALELILACRTYYRREIFK
ncbi:unnamed protein product [Allacma fusca]|uniref:Ionotropic receptor n=1 Tax=Allacma fusca TaxID=39272 RepID=A0A8J2KLZ0_9HEXA|nr:unnamed protein product [Allacma fusca]